MSLSRDEHVTSYSDLKAAVLTMVDSVRLQLLIISLQSDAKYRMVLIYLITPSCFKTITQFCCNRRKENLFIKLGLKKKKLCKTHRVLSRRKYKEESQYTIEIQTHQLEV